MPWKKLERVQVQTMGITIIGIVNDSDNDSNRISSSSQDGTKKDLTISL